MRMMHDPFPVLKTMDSVDPRTGTLAEDTNCFRTDMASEAAGTILQESCRRSSSFDSVMGILGLGLRET